MIKFTLHKGEVVLDTSIVLFDDLKAVYDMPRGNQFLQVIFYRHSREPDNPFRDISAMVLEENIVRVVFRKGTWKEVGITKKEAALFEKAEKIFIEYTTTPEARLERSLNKKLDEISFMLDNEVPKIEKTLTKSNKIEYSTNMTIILNLFTKIETILKGKSILNNVILKNQALTRFTL